MPNYYETLGVGSDAAPEVIQRVYRQLAKAYHPDANPDNPAGAEKLKDLSEAYETLKDPAKRRRYDRALGLGAPRASWPRAPERDGPGRREAERPPRRRADDERRAREEAGRRRQASERERRADEERRRRAADERRAEEERRRREKPRGAGGSSAPTRMQAARERLRARKTALAHLIADVAGRALEVRVERCVGLSVERGWAADIRCSILGTDDDALSLGPRHEILEILLTGTSPELGSLGGRGGRDARLEPWLKAYERSRAETGPATGDPDALRASAARWLAEADGAFRATVWAASCAARVRECEADLVEDVLVEERRQRRLRVMNPIRRWLHASPSDGAGSAQRVKNARARVEQQLHILRKEHAAQARLLQKTRDPLLDGFFEQCLLLTHAAADCVAPYLSSADGALAGLIDERVAMRVDAARSAEARRATTSTHD